MEETEETKGTGTDYKEPGFSYYRNIDPPKAEEPPAAKPPAKPRALTPYEKARNAANEHLARIKRQEGGY